MRLAAILMSSLAVAACNMGASAQESGGEAVQRSYQLSGFDAVGAGGAQDVIVSVGGQHSVRAEGDPEVLDRLDIRVENGTLKIGNRKGSDWSALFKQGRGKTRIFVTMPAIRAASIAGAGDMRIDRVRGDRFEASIAGAGDMDIGDMQVGRAEFSIAGAGDIRANGTAQHTSASVAGAGDIDIGGLHARTASVSLTGMGDVRIHATETADISLVGAGDVEVGGSPRCNVSKRGAGEVRCTA